MNPLTRLALATAVSLVTSSLTAQTATLTFDVNRQPVPTASGARSENTSGFQFFGGRIVVVANDGVHGSELVLVDPVTKQQTVLDIRRGAESSFPQQVVVDAGRIWFSADDGVHGRELWSSDGTLAGTKMLADLSPGIANSNPGGMTACGSRVVFGATTPTEGIELFVSDGTSAGTGLLKEFVPGFGIDGVPQFFTKDPTGPRVYFSAHTATLGRELWITDGTPAGTSMVVDLVPGAGGSNPHSLTVVGSRIVFGSATQLYASDGTAAGTKLLGDGVSPLSSSAILGTGNAQRLFFSKVGLGIGTEIFETDGTPSGTKLFMDLAPGAASSLPHRFVRVSPTTMSFFVLDWQTPARTPQLWWSDGSVSGTRQVAAFPGFEMETLQSVASGNAVFFDLKPLNSLPSDAELYVSLGTSTTTRLITQASGLQVRGPRDVTPLRSGEVVLQGLDRGLGTELFVANFAKLDVLVDIQPPSGTTLSSYPMDFVRLGDKLAFSADDGLHGRELWIYDPTTKAARLVVDLVAGPQSSEARQLCVVGDKVVFSAWTPSTGYEVFVSDGTSNGTMLLADIVSGTGGSLPSRMACSGGLVFFSVLESLNGPYSIWRTDGTVAGTQRVIALPMSTEPYDFCRIGSKLYFVTAKQLWVTDGTAAGLFPVHGFVTTKAFQVGSKIFFVGESAATGIELGVTDGTRAGSMLLDLRPGSLPSWPSTFERHNDKLLFTCSPNGSQYQVWESDGTIAGSKPALAKLFTTRPFYLTSAGSRHFVYSSDSPQGYELQISDGSTASTRTFVDIWPGPGGSFPLATRNFTWLRGHLYCSAYTPAFGNEVWAATGPATSLRAGYGCSLRDEVPDLSYADAVLGSSMRLDVRNASVGSVMVLLFGAEATRGIYPAPGCFSEVDLLRPFTALPVPMAMANFSTTLQVPKDNVLRGLTIASQGFFVGGSLAVAEASNAVHLTFGD